MKSERKTKANPRARRRRLDQLVRQFGCTPCGEYLCQVPMPIAGRRHDIDICIADIVAALNAANIVTVASCCGHGKINGSICLKDGRELSVIMPNPELTLDRAKKETP